MADDVVGEIVVTGRRIRFTYVQRPRGLPDSPPVEGESDELPGTGGGGGGLEDPPCDDLSGQTDAQKTKYLMQFLAQEIAYAMSQRPIQSMEYGSAIWRDENGDFHTTSLIPSPDERARINWSELPLGPDGMPDYGRVVGYVHSHPYENFDPATGGTTIYYNGTDQNYLIRPHSGDWGAYDGLVANMGSSPNVGQLLMFLYGYSETGEPGVPGSMSLHEYGPGDNGNTTDTSEPIGEILPPCNE